MNTPNPLVPQGSLQSNSSPRSNVRWVVLTVAAIHAVFLVGVLLVACKPDKKADDQSAASGNTLPALPQDTNANAPVHSTSSLPPAPGMGSNSTGVAATPTTPGLPAVPSTGTSAPPAAAVSTNPVTPTPIPDTTPAPAATGTSEYVILKGDNFSTIAKKLHVTVKAITAANPGVDSTKLKVGQKIQVPAAAAAPETTAPTTAAAAVETGPADTYTIKPGDTLTKIAKAHKISVKELRAANDLKTDRLVAGRKLKIPAAKTAAAEATPTPTPVTTPAAPTTTVPPSTRTNL